MILSAQSIRKRCKFHHLEYENKLNELEGKPPAHNIPKPMIHPFFERKEIVDTIKIYNGEVVVSAWRDATNADKASGLPIFSYGLSSCGYDVRIAEDIWLWPLWGRLASTIEHFNMPNDVMAEVKDKSSWARRFVTVQNTVIEPGWKGYLTLELTNHRLWPKRIRAGTPIAQIVFKQLDHPTIQPYAGKYQNQPKGPQKAI